MPKKRFLPLILLLSLAVPASAAPGTAGSTGWNDAQIKWRSYEEGLASARKEKKPVCLVFYTTWCPHCKRFSQIFSDPAVVERSKNFVMIRLDSDKNKDLSAKYAVDGEYIPRTFFLSPEGILDPAVHSRRDRYKYFYDESRPEGILFGMDLALKTWPAGGSQNALKTESSPGASPGLSH